MAKFQIPPIDNRAWRGIFEGEFAGNINFARNIDLERSKGKVTLADSYSHIVNSSQGGFSNLTTPIAFVRSSADGTDRWWANGGRLFKTTGTDPEAGWAVDNLADSPTAPLYDLIDFVGALICPTSTDLARLSTTWTPAWWSSLTNASALQALPHRFAIFEGALCITDGRFINDYDGTIARDPALTLPVGFEARWLKVWRDLLFIGGVDTTGAEAKVFTWRRSLVLPEAAYPIGATEALACFVADVPYIITNQGEIKQFTGVGFQTVAKFPHIELGGVLDEIHPNGITVSENIAKILVRGDLEVSLQLKGTADGIWHFDTITKNLYHAGSVRNTTGNDYAQQQLAGVGAIVPTAISQGAYLIGAQVYTVFNGTTRYGIFSSDEGATSNRGYFITPKIPAADSRNYWRYITAKMGKLTAAADRVRVAYRAEDSIVLPAYETITWIAANQFTGSNADAVVGDFVEILAGDNAGAIAPITVIAGGSAPFTFTISTSLNISANTARARYLRFTDLGVISNQTLQEQRFVVAARSNWIQLLIYIEGTELSPYIESLLLEFDPKRL